MNLNEECLLAFLSQPAGPKKAKADKAASKVTEGIQAGLEWSQIEPSTDSLKHKKYRSVPKA